MSDAHENAFIKALGPAYIVQGVTAPGALALPELLGARAWFERRRQGFQSSGGRPTDPRWSFKRAIPLAENTWKQLNELAAEYSDDSSKVGPGQVAACLLEEAVAHVAAGSVPDGGLTSSSEDDAASDALSSAEPRFQEWRMPAPFAA